MSRLPDFISAKTSARDRAQHAANVFVVFTVGLFAGGVLGMFAFAALYSGATR